MLLLGNNLFELKHQGILVFVKVRKVAFFKQWKLAQCCIWLLFSSLKSIVIGKEAENILQVY